MRTRRFPRNGFANSAQLELFPPELSTPVPSKTFQQEISKELTSPTSSQALESGAMPSSSPAGPAPDFGPGLHPSPASHSAKQGNAQASMTPGTSGPSSSVSSSSAHLQSCLANRLRARTDSLGSTIYLLTWRTRVTPAQRSIPALRGSVPRTSAKGSTGSRRGWPTPRTSSANCSDADATRAFDGKSRLETAAHLMPREAQPDIGVMHFSFDVLTDSSARLAPDFARWLTGLPMVWSHCAALATLSMPKPPSASQSRREKRLRSIIEAARANRPR